MFIDLAIKLMDRKSILSTGTERITQHRISQFSDPLRYNDLNIRKESVLKFCLWLTSRLCVRDEPQRTQHSKNKFTTSVCLTVCYC